MIDVIKQIKNKLKELESKDKMEFHTLKEWFGIDSEIKTLKWILELLKDETINKLIKDIDRFIVDNSDGCMGSYGTSIQDITDIFRGVYGK